MKRQTLILTLTIIVIVFLCPVVLADSPTTTGIISRVTVYRGQALVTRSISINLPQDTSELIVKELPAMIGDLLFN